MLTDPVRPGGGEGEVNFCGNRGLDWLYCWSCVFSGWSLMTERRTAPRVEPPKPLSARVKTSLAARVVDMSAKGVQLELTTSLRPEVPCDLRIQLEDGEIIVHGVVRRCRAWGFGLNEKDQKVLMYRAGVEFVEAPPAALAKLIGALLGIKPGAKEVGEGEGAEGEGGQRKSRGGPVRIHVRSADVRVTPKPPREKR